MSRHREWCSGHRVHGTTDRRPISPGSKTNHNLVDIVFWLEVILIDLLK